MSRELLPKDAPATKFCRGCALTKSREEFYSNHRRTDGLGTYCKACSKSLVLAYKRTDAVKLRIRQRRKAMGPVEQARLSNRTRSLRYHVDFESLWIEQRGLCAICNEPMLPNGNGLDSVAVEHDRSCCPTDKFSCGQCVRGLVHKRCNLVIGHARDSVILLRKAIAYLDSNKGRVRDVVKWKKRALGPRAPQIRAENAKRFREQSNAWFADRPHAAESVG